MPQEAGPGAKAASIAGALPAEPPARAIQLTESGGTGEIVTLHVE